ncbi:sulfonate transport system substrate-binding protein [Streptosporangium becharense]|uniref:Putative aliphatic sulfonates-binding protein n=1 Tax=Streptosporangium becharense TaxID=1816182 RepID=A0A7W9MI13_9ACTN|nr:NrtA/SsuA/CpmA family ABC transporter substrate-binding protein [Streptosporangium becharense]MBB2911230.1 sulfonate transport system substrate-binding protein [Streptosporangium becharense]MBB5821712.1 sulfonate transport system substrate-binding protein [Streptosporangium becharense]
MTALLSLTALTAACGGAETGKAAAAAGREGGGAVLKIKDPGNAGPLAVAKKEGILEKRLAEVGAKVEWGGTYASFTATIDAVRSGSVNVLEGAISPVLGYLANGRDIKIFSFTDRVTDPAAPETDGLVVRPDSPIKSVKDLAGKQVAVNKGGRGEYLLLLALQEAGVPVDQVKRVYLNPDQGASAFATGKVDAWWAIVRAYPEAVAKGARVLVNGRDLKDQDLTMQAARTELLEEHPEAVRVYLEVLRELTEEAKRNPEKFQNVFLSQGPTAVSGPRLAEEIAKTKYANVPRPATAADGAFVTDVAAVFEKYGVLPASVKVDPGDVIFELKPAS